MRYLFLFNWRFYQYLAVCAMGALRRLVSRYKIIEQLPPHLRHLSRRNDLILEAPERLHISPKSSLGKGVIIGAPGNLPPDDPARLEIADGAFLGTGVELGLAPRSTLCIGRDTSMHRGTVILGNVQIGCNCILSYNIFIASGNHVIGAKAPWLIKDQDEKYLQDQPIERVIIGDDVWIGWGVFIKSGVTIGKGAIIGANAVVTRDIEPYAICAGNPATPLSKRLEFNPHATLSALLDDDLPYFYSGFRDDQQTLQSSRKRGVIWADCDSQVILSRVPTSTLKLSGLVDAPQQASGTITLRVNGLPLPSFNVHTGALEHTVYFPIEIFSAMPSAPKFLDPFIQVRINYEGLPAFSIGIVEISLV